MSMEALLKRVLTAQEEQAGQKKPKLILENEIEVLKGALASFQKKHNFHVGMIVRQKQGCCYINTPSDNRIGIIVEILDSPVFETEQSSASTYFRRPCDMILGYRVLDGEFCLLHVDSRAFEPVKE